MHSRRSWFMRFFGTEISKNPQMHHFLAFIRGPIHSCLEYPRLWAFFFYKTRAGGRSLNHSWTFQLGKAAFGPIFMAQRCYFLISGHWLLHPHSPHQRKKGREERERTLASVFTSYWKVKFLSSYHRPMVLFPSKASVLCPSLKRVPVRRLQLSRLC